MKRYAVPLVFVGGAALLLGLVVLWKSIGSATEAAAVEPTVKPPAASAPVGAAPTPSTTTPSARVPQPPTLRPHAPEAAPSAPEGPAPSVAQEESGAPGTRLNTKNLEFGLQQMRAQAAANEPKVRECLAQAAATGDKPTGDATLTFIAAKKDGKIVIEETSVDHDASTLKSEPLLECLHATSKSMQFQGLPREADAVIVTRTVKVANGELVENNVTKFSYIH